LAAQAAARPGRGGVLEGGGPALVAGPEVGGVVDQGLAPAVISQTTPLLFARSLAPFPGDRTNSAVEVSIAPGLSALWLPSRAEFLDVLIDRPSGASDMDRTVRPFDDDRRVTE